MEKKKKDNKYASTAIQEAETNDLLSKEDQNHGGARLAGKNTRTGHGSPSNDIASSQNQQYPPILQWPHAPQPTMEQSQLISKPSTPTLSPSPVVLTRWPHQQPNPTSHLVQQGQPPLQLAQPTVPFWMPQRPGYHAPSTYQPFTPLGTTDASWQASVITGGGTSSRHQPQVPNICYHVGYPYPGFPGPWDPSSWWGQAQQSQPPCTYTFPGACGYFSSPPLSMPGCSAAFGQSFQRGIIRPPEKLSQKHQQLWEAQSAENVQLWTIIGHLQSELAEYKNRTMKLEAEVSSLKPTMEEAAAQGTGTSLHGHTSKRGRPKRPVDESHPRPRGRKPALSKVQSETKALNFEKENLNKVEEDKEKACHPPTFHNQIHQDIPGVQTSGVGLHSSSEMKTNDYKAEDSKTALSIFSQHVKRNKRKGGSASYIEGTNNGSLGWPSNITSEYCGRLYNNGSDIRQGGKFFPGWGFANEEDGSGEPEDVVVGSAKDEDEEMEDDVSSSAEEIAQDENAYNIDAPGGTSHSGLPQLNSW